MTDTPTLTIEGKIFVVIPKDEYEALNSMLDETAEDAADRAAFEAAKDEESIPVGFVDRMLAGEASASRLPRLAWAHRQGARRQGRRDQPVPIFRISKTAKNRDRSTNSKRSPMSWGSRSTIWFDKTDITPPPLARPRGVARAAECPQATQGRLASGRRTIGGRGHRSLPCNPFRRASV